MAPPGGRPRSPSRRSLARRGLLQGSDGGGREREKPAKPDLGVIHNGEKKKSKKARGRGAVPGDSPRPQSRNARNRPRQTRPVPRGAPWAQKAGCPPRPTPFHLGAREQQRGPGFVRPVPRARGSGRAVHVEPSPVKGRSRTEAATPTGPVARDVSVLARGPGASSAVFW